MKFALFGNVYQSKKSSSVQRVFSLLSQKGAEIAVEKEFYHFLVEKQHLTLPEVQLIETDDFEADFVLSIGGDGTFLNAAAHVGDKCIPILGINTGRLGFLADAGTDGIESEIEMLYSGDYDIETRTAIFVTGNGRPLCQYPVALNDVAILKRDNASMISIDTHINGEYLTTYLADGLVVSSPTGSTAYSLSIGGPIVTPDNKTLTLTAVAPHSLNIRPIVLSDESVVTLNIESRNSTFLVGIDGRSVKCSNDTEITIRKAPYIIKVVRKKGKNYFDTLKEKLLLGARNNE
ncbi:MAG: NAD kinase [Prevotellaceae bacterium]|nr:NAD kinase [Prevotellaceae bacterium]